MNWKPSWRDSAKSWKLPKTSDLIAKISPWIRTVPFQQSNVGRKWSLFWIGTWWRSAQNTNPESWRSIQPIPVRIHPPFKNDWIASLATTTNWNKSCAVVIPGNEVRVFPCFLSSSLSKDTAWLIYSPSTFFCFDRTSFIVILLVVFLSLSNKLLIPPTMSTRI